MELEIHWSPTNVQRVLALVDKDAECSFLYGNPEKFSGTPVVIGGKVFE